VIEQTDAEEFLEGWQTQQEELTQQNRTSTRLKWSCIDVCGLGEVA
jgi:hypothetical protein